jgi:hypothetical protein
LANVAAEDVRDVLNVSDSDISDAKVLKMIKRAEVTLELELSVDIDYAACTDKKQGCVGLNQFSTNRFFPRTLK